MHIPGDYSPPLNEVGSLVIPTKKMDIQKMSRVWAERVNQAHSDGNDSYHSKSCFVAQSV